MKDLLVRFLQSSHIEPVYFVTFVADLVALFLSRRLKRGLTDLQRALYWAIILVAITMTAGSLCKFFGIIKDW
jgi:hypothetical protein